MVDLLIECVFFRELVVDFVKVLYYCEGMVCVYMMGGDVVRVVEVLYGGRMFVVCLWYWDFFVELDDIVYVEDYEFLFYMLCLVEVEIDDDCLIV